jgi:AcrR family transcriptional regulator
VTPTADVVDRRIRRHAETRSQVLAAAWDLAERRGIASLSLRELASDVGMRAPSLYTYFDSKNAIFDAMFAQGYRELDALYADLPLGADDPVATLTTAQKRFLRFCQQSVPRYQLMFTRVVPDWEPSPEAYAVSVQSYERMRAGLGALGIKGRRALDLWTAISAGLAAQQLANDPAGDRWIRVSRDAVRMFIEHGGRAK